MSGGFARSVRSKVGTMVSGVKHRWLEMLMAAGVGYYVPQTLESLGLGYAAYNSIPQYKMVVDTLYAAAQQAGATNNPWGNGGIVGFGKTYGALDASRNVMTAAKSGRFSEGALVKTAFDVGLILDGPSDYGAGPTQGGSSYW